MAVMGTQAIFKYKTRRGPLHKLPALLKLFLLLPLCVFCMSLAPLWLGVGIFAAAIIAFMCQFTLREQLTDLKPAAYYAFLMYALSVFSAVFDNWGKMPLSALAAAAFIPREEYLYIALRLALVVQLSALLFRTTSSLEIRESLRIILHPRFAQNISLFLSFIPEIFTTWTTINLAWKARSGKQGLAQIKTLVFVLISLSFEKAALKAKALEARGN